MAKKAKLITQKSDVLLRKVVLENFLSFQKGEVNFEDSLNIIIDLSSSRSRNEFMKRQIFKFVNFF